MTPRYKKNRHPKFLPDADDSNKEIFESLQGYYHENLQSITIIVNVHPWVSMCLCVLLLLSSLT